MSDPQSLRTAIGIPTGNIANARPRRCPGAALRVTRADYFTMKREGEVWSTGEKDIRHDGYSDARTLCSSDIAEIRVPTYQRRPEHPTDKEQIVEIYHAGTCASCCRQEEANRRELLFRKQPTSSGVGGSPGGGRGAPRASGPSRGL